ncbi:hypothetical protein GGH95_001457 [Coemansia sp. RSA 1836]|nr:hypothetical protein GGH95_001457 [Coemansia sp. RSA 1836]
MESNNLYVFYQGDLVLKPKKSFLFVFPYSDNLTTGLIKEFIGSVFKKKSQEYPGKRPIFCMYNVIETILKQDEEGPNKSKKAIITGRFYDNTTILTARPLVGSGTRGMPRSEILNMESKMDELIKFYETSTADTPALKMGTVLTAKNIYHYDPRMFCDAYAFDKRSDEGNAAIEAKIAAKQEKMSILRTYNANDKRRCKSIDVSKLGFYKD